MQFKFFFQKKRNNIFLIPKSHVHPSFLLRATYHEGNTRNYTTHDYSDRECVIVCVVVECVVVCVVAVSVNELMLHRLLEPADTGEPVDVQVKDEHQVFGKDDNVDDVTRGRHEGICACLAKQAVGG